MAAWPESSMKSYSSYLLGTLAAGLSEARSRAVEPVAEEMARSNEAVQDVRVGPARPVAEYLDIEAVRLRIAQEQRGQPWPGQVKLVERLRSLPPEKQITYVILATPTRQAKCYVDGDSEQLLGVLWLPGGGGDGK